MFAKPKNISFEETAYLLSVGATTAEMLIVVGVKQPFEAVKEALELLKSQHPGDKLTLVVTS